MVKVNQLYYSLVFFIFLMLLAVFLYSCETSPVSAIQPTTYVEPTVLPQLEGKVSNINTGEVITDAEVTLGGTTVMTDAEGKFTFEDQISSGTTEIIIRHSGFVSVRKNVNIPEIGASIFREFKMPPTAPPVIISAANGGDVSSESDDGTFDTSIPPGAVNEDVEVSVTPTLGASSPVEISSVVTEDEAPAQSVLLEPADLQFNQPVEMKAPLSFPSQYLTGEVDVVRINPTTNQPEVVGTATVENGKFKYNINMGGQYIVKAKTSLRHEVETVREVVKIGELGFNDRPGTFRNFSFTETSDISPDPGFSRKFVETVFGFSNASRSITLAVVKDAGSSNAVSSYAIVEKVIHTYTTPEGRIIAKSVTQNNQGTESSYGGNYQAKWSASGTHGIATFLGWWSPLNNRYLTDAEITSLGLPNPPPAP